MRQSDVSSDSIEEIGDISGEAHITATVVTFDGKLLRELARPNIITEDQIRSYIAYVPWRQSIDKSHEYTLFKWCLGLWPYFAAFAQHIRNHGYKAYFHQRHYTAFDVDGKRYWTMGYPILSESPEDRTILINRANNLPGNPHRDPSFPLTTNES